MSPADASPIVGVLLMAYGSPEDIKDLPAYLLDIRGGRETPQALVDEIVSHYRQIGGTSPLLALTCRQAQALETELNRSALAQGNTGRFRTYVGMRHWDPRIKHAVEQMATGGIHQVVALVMAPHASRMSTGSYYAMLEKAIAETGADFDLLPINSWHDLPGLIAALAEKARLALAAFGGDQPYVIFSAHSLPERILAQGDPYDAQLRETAGLVAARLGLAPDRWCFSYQSAGQSREPWLGPSMEETIVGLAAAGEKNLLVVPVGFVCDHVEILYDLDILARQQAARYGIRLERSGSLNDDPIFIAALAKLVKSQLVDQRVP